MTPFDEFSVKSTNQNVEMSHRDENEHISSTVLIDENNDLACQQQEKVSTELEKQENQQATSSENQHLVYFPDSEIGTRLRKRTEKGKTYQLKLSCPKCQDCYRNLAKYLKTTYEILDAETDFTTLERLRDALDKSKEELNHAQNNLYDELENEKERNDSYN